MQLKEAHILILVKRLCPFSLVAARKWTMAKVVTASLVQQGQSIKEHAFSLVTVSQLFKHSESLSAKTEFALQIY